MATILQRVQDAHPCSDELAALVQEQLAIGVVLEPGTLVECSCGKQYVKVDPATNDGVEWKKKRAPRKTKAQKAAEAAVAAAGFVPPADPAAAPTLPVE